MLHSVRVILSAFTNVSRPGISLETTLSCQHIKSYPWHQNSEWRTWLSVRSSSPVSVSLPWACLHVLCLLVSAARRKSFSDFRLVANYAEWLDNVQTALLHAWLACCAADGADKNIALYTLMFMQVTRVVKFVLAKVLLLLLTVTARGSGNL